MSYRTAVTLFAFSFLLLGCQAKTADPEENSAVDLASENLEQPLEASFMSDQQSFSYTLFYDGALMQIVDGQFDGASVVGPSFSVQGGSQIVVKSITTSEAQTFMDAAGQPGGMNGLTMYHMSKTVGSCAVDTTLVPVSVEALELTFTSCDGQDLVLGQQAMYELLNGLEIVLR